MCPRDEDEATMVGSLNIPASLRENIQMSPTFLVVSGQASAGKMFKLRGEMIIGRATTADISEALRARWIRPRWVALSRAG